MHDGNDSFFHILSDEEASDKTAMASSGSSSGRPRTNGSLAIHHLMNPSTAADDPHDDRETTHEEEEEEEEQEQESQMPQIVAELQTELHCLDNVVRKLEQEKSALKMRLNEIEYFQKFNAGDCRRWLQANYEFDRKDTPELIATIFENYLLQNQDLDVLPHQLIIKNSARARARRERSQQQSVARMMQRERRRERIANPTETTTEASSKQQDSGDSNEEMYIPAAEIERLYASEPWKFLITKWPMPKIKASSSSNAAKSLDKIKSLSQSFLEKHAWAIWERNHWFPIKKNSGKNAKEVEQLTRAHGKRKRRQANLKSDLEKNNKKVRTMVDANVFRQSIFSDKTVDAILQRPRAWLPDTGKDLCAQLRQLDAKEPDRNFNYL